MSSSSLLSRASPLLFAFFLYSISFGATIPAFPAILNTFTHNNVETSSLYFGAANFIKHGLEFFSTPVLGSLSDRLGRRRLLLFGLFIVTLESCLIFLFPSLASLLLSKVLAGTGDCVYLIAFTIMTDLAVAAIPSSASLTSSSSLTTGFGYVSAAFSAGFILGPLVGSTILSYASPPFVFLFTALCTALAFLFIALCFTESLVIPLPPPAIPPSSFPSTSSSSSSSSSSHVMNSNRLNPFTTLALFFQDSLTTQLAFPYFLNYFISGIYIIFVLHMKSTLHSSSALIGIYLSFFGVLSVFHELISINVLLHYTSNLITNEILIIALLLLEGVRFIMYSHCTDMPSFFLTMVLFSITIIYPLNLKTLMYQASSSQPQGSIQGALGSLRTLGLGAGSLFFSFLYAYTLETREKLDEIEPLPMALARTHTVIARGGLPFLVAALLSIGGGIYCFFLFRSDSYTTKMSQRVLQSKSIAGAKVSSTVYVENDIRFVDIGQLEPLIYQEVN